MDIKLQGDLPRFLNLAGVERKRTIGAITGDGPGGFANQSGIRGRRPTAKR